MLAYVFWHRPRAGVASSEYETALARFHRSLAQAAPPGFDRSASYRIAARPWTGIPPGGYEDWYLVADWRALGDLNAAAVSGARAEPHDHIAMQAGDGAGAVYGLRMGHVAPDDARHATWFAKPPGISYGDLDGLLQEVAGGPGHALWQRQMVLGPAPEFCLLGPAETELPPGLRAFHNPLRALWRRAG